MEFSKVTRMTPPEDVTEPAGIIRLHMSPASLFKAVSPLLFVSSSLPPHPFTHSHLPFSVNLLSFSSFLPSSPSPTRLFFLHRGGIMLMKWVKWEVSFKSLEAEYFLMDFFYCLDCFARLMGKRLWGPLISGQPEDAFKFLFLFPSWFLTNASRRSLSGPPDSGGWSITPRTSALQKRMSWMGGFEEGERAARAVSELWAQGRWSDGLLSPELLLDKHKYILAPVAALPLWFLLQLNQCTLTWKA